MTSIEFYLEMQHFSYERDKTALTVWETIQFCIAHESPMPEWALQYLYDIASRFMDLRSSEGNLGKTLSATRYFENQDDDTDVPY